jgi:ribonuclease E
VKVVRDLFTEDFSALVIQGDIAWETVDAYVRHVAPELADRVRKHIGNTDVFAEYRIDEQLLKALDRKVWLPSGGYLVIDRTEAMTVIDVNTGKFTGSGGNLEETVTRNNLESAEEIVRQLRLRDIGGIIVIDFIDMVLESNRDLVLRRLTECLGRDRTRHQVAEVTSLGLVQMTRKRVGTGLLEAFGTTCEHCKGRGVLVTTEPVSKSNGSNGHTEQPARGNTRRSRGRTEEAKDTKPPSKDVAKEAAAQAAKEAVRDIAKATTKAVPGDEATTPEPAPETSEAQADGAKQPAETADTRSDAAQTSGSPRAHRHRTRDRSHRAERAEARNGASVSHAGEPTDGATRPDEHAYGHTNGSATRPGAEHAASEGHGTPAEATSPSGSRSPETPSSETASVPAAASVSPAHGTSEVGEPAIAASQAEVPSQASSRSDRSSGVSGRAASAADQVSSPSDRLSGGSGESGRVAGATGQSDLSGQPSSSSDRSVGLPATSAGTGDESAEASGASSDEPSVPAPVTPPRRQPRRAASRPAGPPVSARHDG